MHCKPILCAYTTAAQTITTSGTLNFATNKILSGIGFTHPAGGDTVTVARGGTYFISVDADIEPSAAGNIALQLYNNGVPVPDAIANFTGVNGDTQHIHFDTLQKVLPSCCVVSNAASLQVMVTGDSVVTNAKIIML